MVHGKNFARMLNMVKAAQGGEEKKCPEDEFIAGRVQLACFKCWIKATNNKDYQKDDGSLSTFFRNMANFTKPGAQDALTKKDDMEPL
eukprot:6105175-Amphidinium_carterae.1